MEKLRYISLEEWQNSKEDFDTYITEPCKIEYSIIEDLTYYAGSIQDENIIQVDEPYDTDSEGYYIYSTFIELNKEYYYIGHLKSCNEFIIYNDIMKILNKIL